MPWGREGRSNPLFSDTSLKKKGEKSCLTELFGFDCEKKIKKLKNRLKRNLGVQ
jgi:hypothetical protein